MANVDNPIGFQYLSMGKPYPPRTRTYEKQSGFGTAIFQNDCVMAIAGVTGFNAPPIESFSTPGTLIPLGISLNYGAASTRTRHHVIVDVDQEFVAQDDADTDGIVAADLGSNALVSIGAGSVLTGFSGHEIDEAGITTSGTASELRLLRLFPDPLNNFGSHARIILKFVRLSEAQNTPGI